ncbi:unnamed protein product [Prorocentrum cordatum]|uniref:Uncharacterized protein n=1 Tax=Prorocentrum cordatum TaxID=2364126 RepID=A0ABN9RRY7_9DINO|nr:unnamed protein product [Polarella glacialis]
MEAEEDDDDGAGEDGILPLAAPPSDSAVQEPAAGASELANGQDYVHTARAYVQPTSCANWACKLGAIFPKPPSILIVTT